MSHSFNASRAPLLLLVTVFLLCSYSAAQDAPDKTEAEAKPPKLEPAFSDDFSKDTRDDYEIKGDVAWKPGELVLSKGAFVERGIEGGSRASVDLTLKWRESSEMRVVFLLDDMPHCFVRLRSDAAEGPPRGKVALFDTQNRILFTAENLIRESDMPPVAESLSIDYVNGLVLVRVDGRLAFAAFCEKGTTAVTGCRIVATSGSQSLASIAMRRDPPPAPLTPEQRQQAAKASASNQRLMRLYRQGEFAKAAEVGEQTLRIDKAVLGERHPDYAASLNNLAAMYRSKGDYARAKPLYEQASEIWQQALGELHPHYATSLNNLALLHSQNGDHGRAESLYQEALRIRQFVLGERHPDYAASLSNLATEYIKTGDYSSAEPISHRALEIWKSTLGEQHPHYATGLANLAGIYESMGRYSRAEPLALQALQIRRRTLGKRHPQHATGLNNLAALYAKMGDHARAEQLLNEALEIRKTALGERHPDYALTLSNLGGLYEVMGDHARAERCYEQALEIRKTLGTRHPDYVTGLNNLASLYEQTGQHVRAAEILTQVMEIRKTVLGEHHVDYALSLNNLAGAYGSMGELERAEPLYQRSLEINASVLGEQHPRYAASLRNLAWLYEGMGDHARAEPLQLKSHRAASTAAAALLPTLSDAQARRWMSRHRPRADLVLASLRKQEKWEATQAYSTVWRTKGLVRRLKVGQSLSKTSSSESREVFSQLRDARLRLARLVSAKPAADEADRYHQAMAAANRRKEQLEKRLAAVNPASMHELAVRDATVEDLCERLPRGVAVVDLMLLNDWVFPSLENAAPKEGPDQARTFSARAKPVYDAFVVRSDRAQGENPARWIPLGAAEPIEQTLSRWRDQLTGENARGRRVRRSKLADPQSKDSDPGVTLRETVWEKLEPELKGCHTVIILPDGALNKLPWAALPGRRPRTYLIQDYAIGVADYGQQLFGLLASEPLESEARLLVAGGIQYDQRTDEPERSDVSDPLTVEANRSIQLPKEARSWPYLPGAEQEARNVADLWGDRGSAIRLHGLKASETQVTKLLPTARFAHLATHGFFDKAAEVYRVNLREQLVFETSSRYGATVAARNPLLMTGIVLAGANLGPDLDGLGLPVSSDGILTAEEIGGLDLRNTELVTLSACETGLGDVAAGQGVFGLTRALHEAGARGVVASLWKVDDAATQALMTEFYTNLWRRKLGKLESLRQAQLKMIRNYDAKEGVVRGLTLKTVKVKARAGEERPALLPPRYWAAFQFSGDWR